MICHSGQGAGIQSFWMPDQVRHDTLGPTYNVMTIPKYYITKKVSPVRTEERGRGIIFRETLKVRVRLVGKMAIGFHGGNKIDRRGENDDRSLQPIRRQFFGGRNQWGNGQ